MIYGEKGTDSSFAYVSVTWYFYIYLYVWLDQVQYFSAIKQGIQKHYIDLTRKEKRSVAAQAVSLAKGKQAHGYQDIYMSMWKILWSGIAKITDFNERCYSNTTL